MSEQTNGTATKPRVDRALIDAAIRQAVREEVLLNARLGFMTCGSKDGKVVWYTPQEVFAMFASEPNGAASQ